MKEEIPVHFIVGMSRAGTTWMAKCINSHPSSAAFGETLYWGRIYLEPKPNGRYAEEDVNKLATRLAEIRIGPCNGDFGSIKGATAENWKKSIYSVVNTATEKTPRGVFLRLCEFVAAEECVSSVVEKTPHHINWVERIAEQFPKAKFVVMVREPYGFLLSYKNQGSHQSEKIRMLFKRQYHPLQSALVWRGYARSAKRALAQFPDRTKLVRFEEIARSPEDLAKGVFRFLNLEEDPVGFKVPNKTNSSVSSSITEPLNAADYFWFRVFNFGAANELGYEIVSKPIFDRQVLFSILKIPSWVFRTITLLRKNSQGNLTKYLVRWLS